MGSWDEEICCHTKMIHAARAGGGNNLLRIMIAHSLADSRRRSSCLLTLPPPHIRHDSPMPNIPLRHLLPRRPVLQHHELKLLIEMLRPYKRPQPFRRRAPHVPRQIRPSRRVEVREYE